MTTAAPPTMTKPAAPAAGAAGTKAPVPAKAGAKPPVKAAARPPSKARKATRPPRPPMLRRLGAAVRGFRFRLLPLTIFAAVLMLGLRVGDVWRLATRQAEIPEFPVSLASAPAPASPGGGAGATPAQGPAPAPGPNNPLGPIDNKELLQHYADRRAELDKRTKDVEQREALLAAAEKRIEQKLGELEKVRGEIQKLLRMGDQRQSEQLDSLVKIYETMKPKEAARIFEELDMNVLLDVFGKMKEAKSAPILAAMDPVKAKGVTSALVERRALPAVPQ